MIPLRRTWNHSLIRKQPRICIYEQKDQAGVSGILGALIHNTPTWNEFSQIFIFLFSIFGAGRDDQTQLYAGDLDGPTYLLCILSIYHSLCN